MSKMKAVAVLLGMVGLLPAAQANTILPSFKQCKAVADPVKRLACYDAITVPNNRSLPAEAPAEANEDAGITDSQKNKPVAAQPPSTIPTPAPPARVPKEAHIAPQEQKTVSGTDSSATEFGLAPKVRAEEIDRIVSEIEDITESARGIRSFHLDNGSVWQQADRNRLKLKTGMTIYIERGMLGAFYLSMEGTNRRIKVKRIE